MNDIINSEIPFGCSCAEKRPMPKVFVRQMHIFFVDNQEKSCKIMVSELEGWYITLKHSADKTAYCGTPAPRAERGNSNIVLVL